MVPPRYVALEAFLVVLDHLGGVWLRCSAGELALTLTVAVFVFMVLLRTYIQEAGNPDVSHERNSGR